MTQMRSLLLLALVGCAPALSSFQPAHVGKKGTVSVELGADVSVPTGTIGKVVDAGEALSDAAADRELTDEERDQVIEAGATLALAPPGFNQHVGGYYVPKTGWEIGLRYQGGGWRVGMRHQILKQEDNGIDLTVGIGAARFAFEFPIDNVFDILTLEDFTRYTVDIPVQVGQHGDFYRWWIAPRLVFDSYGTSLKFTQPTTSEVTLASIDGKSAFVGGQAGLAVGYRKIFIAAELTMARLISTAHMSVLDEKRDFDIGGLIVYPGLAIMGEL